MAFGGGDTLETFERIGRGEYEPLDSLLESCPLRMRVTIERALQVDASDRFTDAAEMLESWTGQADGSLRLDLHRLSKLAQVFSA